MSDDSQVEPEPPGTVGARAAWPLRGLDSLLMALRFYSRLPTGGRPHLPPDLSRMAIALPFASLLIGLIPTLVWVGAASTGLAGMFAAGLAVAAHVVVTGAMSEDALADAADGLFGGQSPERRLEIMKDSRHGTYGVAALGLLLILRVGALTSLADLHPLATGLLWLAATLLARSGALWLLVALPPARRTGVSAGAGRPSTAAFAIGLALAVVFAAGLALVAHRPTGLAVALPLMAIIAVGWTSLCRRLVGGQTGDLAGALQALLELAALGAFLALR